MSFHSAQTPAEGIHVSHAFEFNDLTAAGAYSYTVNDIGKIIRVGTTAPYSFYILQDDATPTLGSIDTSSLVAHASSHHSGGSDPLDLGSIDGTLTDSQHGSRSGGSLHADATPSTAGFMPSADKTKLDNITDTGSGEIITTAERNGISANSSAIFTLGSLITTDYQAIAEKGVADGYASLDSNGMVPFSELPIFAEAPQILDGMAFDKIDITIVDSSGLQVEVEKVGTGNVKFYLNDEEATLDCTTGSGTGGKARAALTAGTDANTPTLNYVYVTGSGATATLVASTTIPTGSFAWVCAILVPDATTWATTGAYKIHRFTEAFLNDSRGALSHQREKLRALGAVYIDGGETTVSISTATSPDTVHAQVSAANVYQLHRQAFPAFSAGPYRYGNGLNIYEEIAHLGLIANTSDGTALSNNDRINVVIWGAVNIDSGSCLLFANLPNGVYASDANAAADVDNTADYSVPSDMRSVAFMIARVVLRYQSAGGGTWTEVDTFSLLGDPIGVRSGGSTSVRSSEFSDGSFKVFNAADATKAVQLDVSGVATATTRTLTAPNADGTLYLNPGVVSQAEAEAGTATTERIWTAERVAQAIAALGSGLTYIGHDLDTTGYSSNATSEVDAHTWTTPTLDAGNYLLLVACSQKNNNTSAQSRIRFYFDGTKISPEGSSWWAQNVSAAGNRFSIMDYAYINVASGGSTYVVKNTMEVSGSATTLSIESSQFMLFRIP